MKDELISQEGIDMAKKCLRVARDGGVNLFDNAEVYGVPYGEVGRRPHGAPPSGLPSKSPKLCGSLALMVRTKVVVFVAGC